jgi:cytidine deaminase
MEQIINKARQAALGAYAKYSLFRVGAAILAKNGQIITGCNIENVSYGLTMCAERVAVYKAISEGISEFETLVIYTPTLIPTPPCGACRQVLAEFSRELDILCICDSEEVISTKLSLLLPHSEIPLKE